MLKLGATVLVVAVGASSAFSQETHSSGTQAQVGIGAGVVTSGSSGAGVWPTVSLRIPLKPRLFLEPEIGFWGRRPNADSTLAQVIDVGANLLVSFGGKRLRPWAGGGLGIHVLRYKSDIYCSNCNDGGPAVLGVERYSKVGPRGQMLAGLDYSVSERLVLYGAARMDLAFLGDDVPLQGKLYAGLRWRL